MYLLTSLQCFDAIGWVTGKASAACRKTYFNNIFSKVKAVVVVVVVDLTSSMIVNF